MAGPLRQWAEQGSQQGGAVDQDDPKAALVEAIVAGDAPTGDRPSVPTRNAAMVALLPPAFDPGVVWNRPRTERESHNPID